MLKILQPFIIQFVYEPFKFEPTPSVDCIHLRYISELCHKLCTLTKLQTTTLKTLTSLWFLRVGVVNDLLLYLDSHESFKIITSLK